MENLKNEDVVKREVFGVECKICGSTSFVKEWQNFWDCRIRKQIPIEQWRCELCYATPSFEQICLLEMD